MTRPEESDAPHLQDNVQPFLQPEFDPAVFLNNTLPALSASNSTRAAYSNTASLSDIAAQTQTLLSQLSAQTTRLSNTLTQLTDEIVRSGGRLAYEVELLRGETIGLADSLDGELKQDIEIFVPTTDDEIDTARALSKEQEDTTDPLVSVPLIGAHKRNQPQYLAKLHTLAVIRERLDSVVKLFDEAMKWPMAPVDASSLSTTLIAVSAPKSSDTDRELEAKANEFADNLRQELNSLIAQGIEGEDAAMDKLSRLQLVAEVWTGTAEEKNRAKLLTELQKLVDDQRRPDNNSTRAGKTTRTMDYRYGGGESYGFLNNLRNLKNEVYLE